MRTARGILGWRQILVWSVLAVAGVVVAHASRVEAQTPTETPPAEATAAEAPPATEPEPAPAAPAPAPPTAAPPEAAKQFDQKATTDRPKEDETVWSLNAGGVLNTGNTRSVAVNLGTRFALKRKQNQFTADAQFVFGRASVKDSASGTYTGMRTNAENLNAQARYDRFLTEKDGVFGGLRFRRDRFAGLDARIQAQTGYVRDLYKVANHRLWGEAGYDFTYDNFYPNPILDTTTGAPIKDSRAIHSARLFVGYDNHLNAAVTFITGLEGLLNVENTKQVRLQSVSELNSKIADNLQAGVTFTLRFDNVPVPGAQKLDTLTMLNLIYSLL